MTQAPMIHLNGTSKESLITDLTEALTAANSLFTTLQRMSPNGRDYYTLPDVDGRSALSIAQDEHRNRLDLVHRIQTELLDIGEQLIEQ